MEDDEDLKNLTDKQLIQKLDKEVQEYSVWAAKEYSLAEGWEEEVMVVAIERELIHDEIAELKTRGLDYDIQHLKLIDKKWQALYAQGVAKKDQIGLNRSHIPKARWWWWIDQLKDLTGEERSMI